MTLEEEYQLSCYEEVAVLNDAKEIYLVREQVTGELYVKKKIKVYDTSVYDKLKRMQIKQIPKVILHIEDGEHLILIEEYIHGKNYQQIMENTGLLTETEAVRRMIELCKILEQLHSCKPPIIHRDIKPSNLMISTDGVLKLIDFNAAKEYHSTKSEDTVLMGTKEYAAPEQYGFGQSDVRTDIYSLGITFHVLLTGEIPKKNKCSGKVGKIIEKCIAMEPDKRYQTVTQLKNELYSIGIQCDTHDETECFGDSRGKKSLGILLAGISAIVVIAIGISKGLPYITSEKQDAGEATQTTENPDEEKYANLPEEHREFFRIGDLMNAGKFEEARVRLAELYKNISGYSGIEGDNKFIQYRLFYDKQGKYDEEMVVVLDYLEEAGYDKDTNYEDTDEYACIVIAADKAKELYHVVSEDLQVRAKVIMGDQF